MLTIRDSQVSALGAASAARFTERMVAHVAEEFPESHQRLGKEGIRQFVEEAIRSAASHRVFAQGAVIVYLELILDFGKKFERSPDRAWATRLLDHATLPDYVRLEVIRDRMMSRTDGRRIVQQKLPESEKA